MPVAGLHFDRYLWPNRKMLSQGRAVCLAQTAGALSDFRSRRPVAQNPARFGCVQMALAVIRLLPARCACRFYSKVAGVIRVPGKITLLPGMRILVSAPGLSGFDLSPDRSDLGSGIFHWNFGQASPMVCRPCCSVRENTYARLRLDMAQATVTNVLPRNRCRPLDPLLRGSPRKPTVRFSGVRRHIANGVSYQFHYIKIMFSPLASPQMP